MTPEEHARQYFIEQIPVDVVTDKRVNALARVISAAVAAEHQRTKERCAKVATDYHSDDCDDQCCTCRPIAAAIRALP